VQDVDRLGERSRAVLAKQRQRPDLVQVDVRLDKRGTDQAPFDVELGERVTVDLADLSDQARRYADVGEPGPPLEAAVPHNQVERRGGHGRPPPSCGVAGR
jgi:hypothetical protein